MIVGTRPSRLALRQVEEIQELFPGIRFDVVTIETVGDRDKITPLSDKRLLAISNLFFINVNHAECVKLSLYEKLSFKVLYGGSM